MHQRRSALDRLQSGPSWAVAASDCSSAANARGCASSVQHAIPKWREPSRQAVGTACTVVPELLAVHGGAQQGKRGDVQEGAQFLVGAAGRSLAGQAQHSGGKAPVTAKAKSA